MQKAVWFGSIFVSMSLLGAETKIAFRALPSAVQAAARAEARGADMVGASKETENGKTVYEVETKQNGKSRDLTFDANGKLVEVEQEVTLDDIPAPAKAALQKKAEGGTIRKVETVTEGTTVSYEAALTTKSGKHTEVAVNADGTPHRN